MEQNLERSEVIELLRQLGETEDEKVLAAARALHEKVVNAGFDWDTLLAPDASDDSEEDDDWDDDAESEDSPSQVPVAEAGDSLSLIETLLSDKGISETLREELQGYKDDINENEFTESDAAYLATLAERLRKPTKDTDT